MKLCHLNEAHIKILFPKKSLDFNIFLMEKRHNTSQIWEAVLVTRTSCPTQKGCQPAFCTSVLVLRPQNPKAFQNPSRDHKGENICGTQLSHLLTLWAPSSNQPLFMLPLLLLYGEIRVQPTSILATGWGHP